MTDEPSNRMPPHPRDDAARFNRTRAPARDYVQRPREPEPAEINRQMLAWLATGFACGVIWSAIVWMVFG